VQIGLINQQRRRRDAHQGDNTMTITESTAPAALAERNGVPFEKLFGTITKMGDNPELAAFQFTATNTWVDGTASTSTIHEWFGAGAEQQHVQEFTATSDHPTLGHGHGPTPHEFVLHALASCIAAGVATTATARNIELTRVDTVARGKMDVRGILGVDPDVRNGFNHIDIDVKVEGNAPKSELDALIAASAKRSAVFDSLANPTTLDIHPTR
jgi:uncharacterized OsmC-like protein